MAQPHTTTTIEELEEPWTKRERPGEHPLDLYHCAQTFYEITKLYDEDVEDEAEPQFSDGLGKAVRDLLAAIGSDLGLSADAVSRHLGAAHSKKVLYFREARPFYLERALQDKLRLQRVIVGKVDPPSAPEEAGGEREQAVQTVVADYFVTVIKNPDKPDRSLPDPELDNPPLLDSWIGVSGGYTMLRVVDRLRKRLAEEKRDYRNLTVCSLAGAADIREFHISADSVAAELATMGQAVGRGSPARTWSLQVAPLTGKAWDTVGSIIREGRHYLQWRAGARSVRFAFTGIGGFHPFPEEYPEQGDTQSRLSALAEIAQFVAAYEASGSRARRYSELRRELVGKDDDNPRCVGDILYRPIDRRGKPIDCQIVERVVGLESGDLQGMAERKDCRIFAVACGLKKVPAIYAACTGRFVNALATDEVTAQELLDHIEMVERSKARPKRTTNAKKPKQTG